MKDNRGIYGFLIEFIIMICIFSVISIVTVTLFSRADSLDEDTEFINQGLLLSENVAEKMKSYNGEDLEVFLEGYDLENIEVSVNEVTGKKTLYQSTVVYKDNQDELIEFKVSSIGDNAYE